MAHPYTMPDASLEGDRFVLVLPFPDRRQYESLSSNGRVGWRRRSRATKHMRVMGLLLTRSAIPPTHTPWSRARLTYGFYWPNLYRRDTENYRGVCKPAIDGIVEAGLVLEDNWKVLSSGAGVISQLDRARPRIEIIIERMEATE